jgi:hypothetical protein
MRKSKTKFNFFVLLLLAWLVNLPSAGAQPCVPVLSGVPNDIFLECGKDLPAWPTVTASCGAVVTRVQLKTGSKCGNVIYYRRWTATNIDGTVVATQTIQFKDDVPPVLIVPADTIIYCGYPVPEPDVYCDDACSWNEVVYSEKRTTHNDCEYTLVRTWTATDGCGNTDQKTQRIDVVDNHAPVITVVNPLLKNIKLGGEMAVYDCENPQVFMSDVKVTDCCKFTLEVYDKLLVSGKCALWGYHRKWKCGYIATDKAGNKSEFYFYVVQYDDEAPVLHNVPEDIILGCDDTLPAIDPYLVEVEDNCSRRTKVDISQGVYFDPADSSNYAVKRTWYFADDCGNAVSESQWILTCDFDTTLLHPDTSGMETDSSMVGSIPLTIDGQNQESNSNSGSSFGSLVVYPNPTQSKVTMEFVVEEIDHLNIQLVDKLGRILTQKNSDYTPGVYTHTIDLTPHPVGFYSVVLTSKQGKQYKSIIKTD